MQAWTRAFSILFCIVTCGLLNLQAADNAENSPPKEFKLRLYQIEGSQTGKPECATQLEFLKSILTKSFPQFDTFKLLLSPDQVLTTDKNPIFTTGSFTTQVTLIECVAGKNDDGQAIWKAKLKLECKSAAKVLYNPTIQILPGGQHIWSVDKIIFVLYLPTE